MKIFKTLGVLAIATLSFNANANVESSTSPKEQCSTNSINVEVNGLVCDFCARALEKVFGKKDEVAGIDVNLKEGYVKINLNNGRNLKDEEIRKLITDSGYNVVNIKNDC